MSTSKTTIQIGDGGSAYVFDVPPEFAPQTTTLRNARGERTGEHHRWPVRGYLRGAGPDNINALWNDLKTRLRTEKVNVYFKHDTTVLQQLLASSAERGPKFDGPSIEPEEGTCWDSSLLFSFDIEADIYDTQDGVIEVEYTVSYRQNADGSFTRTKSGSVATTHGTSAHAAALAQAPSVPSNYRLSSSSVAPNTDDTQAGFTFVMESLFSSLPDQVMIAERVVDESVENGVRTTTYRATFTGPGAARAAEDYRPDETVLSRSTSTSEDRDTVSVTYTVREPLPGSPRMSYSNSISMEKSVPKVEVMSLEGHQSVAFRGGDTPAFVRENGETAYRDSVPPEVPPLASAALFLTGAITSVEPSGFAEDGAPAGYVRRWSYTYTAVSNEDVSAALPELYNRLSSLPE
jgi:hypothetical protein